MLQGCTHSTVLQSCWTIQTQTTSTMELQIWWDLCLVSWREGIVLIVFLKTLVVKVILSLFEQWNVFVSWKLMCFITTIVTVSNSCYVIKKCILCNWLKWIPRGGIILSFGVCGLTNRSAPKYSTVVILSGLGPEFLTHTCNGSMAACTLLFKLFYYLSPEIWDVSSDIFVFAIQNLSMYLAQFSAKWSVG